MDNQEKQLNKRWENILRKYPELVLEFNKKVFTLGYIEGQDELMNLVKQKMKK